MGSEPRYVCRVDSKWNLSSWDADYEAREPGQVKAINCDEALLAVKGCLQSCGGKAFRHRLEDIHWRTHRVFSQFRVHSKYHDCMQEAKILHLLKKEMNTSFQSQMPEMDTLKLGASQQGD